ncbi:MBL fold metallo-hydrolase [Algibacter sp. L4_22]|uniref:MBL fold metallo-hydrolase n=1 Tax=Algibacter sp. L4_22 TaxID=2942477 RepID=UPI00201B4EC4|nr:MBL fold metallo-hydrolase [Algibacter sp. L4_22]MCL5128028.1 MBL fold metallo-hydrolase [Algibacter sp. L4_22]
MKKYIAALIFCLSFQIFSYSQNQLTATIIGSGSPKYNIERAGPSVLISYKNTNILVDMGNGAQANLEKLNIKTKDLNALLFTHHHLDHNEEFTPIFIKTLLSGNDFEVIGPKPTNDLVNSILKNYEEDIAYRLSKKQRTFNDVASNFSVKELKGGETFSIGEISISCTPVKHTISTMAYRFDAGGTSIVISGDLSYSESLPILAKQADYLIIDSGGSLELGKTNTKKGNGKARSNKEHAHVNLDESSRMANEAKVKNLVLTHFTFTNIDEAATSAELNKNYTGTIFYAEDLMSFPKLEGNIEPSKQSRNNNKTNQSPNFKNMLNRMDADKDGKISKTEAKGKLKENFTKRDSNNDGFITENELGSGR